MEALSLSRAPRSTRPRPRWIEGERGGFVFLAFFPPIRRSPRFNIPDNGYKSTFRPFNLPYIHRTIHPSTSLHSRPPPPPTPPQGIHLDRVERVLTSPPYISFRWNLPYWLHVRDICIKPAMLHAFLTLPPQLPTVTTPGMGWQYHVANNKWNLATCQCLVNTDFFTFGTGRSESGLNW